MTDDASKTTTDPVADAAAKTAAAMTSAAVAPKPDDKGGMPAEPAKLTLTEQELNDRIAAALKAREDTAAEDARKAKEQAKRDKDESDRKAAAEAGKHEEAARLERERAEKAEQRAASLELDNRRKDVALWLRDHLAEAKPEYATSAVDILPHVAFEANTPEKTVRERIADAVKAFADRNPRQPKGAGAPGPIPVGYRAVRPSGSATAANGYARPVGIAGTRF